MYFSYEDNLGESGGILSVILPRTTKEKLNKQKNNNIDKDEYNFAIERSSKMMGNENRLKLD